MGGAGLDWPTLVGFVGMGCIIAAYAYMTYAAQPNPFVLHGTNLLGAILLTISLLYHMNWPSLVLEFFWAAIAIGGLIKAARARTRREAHSGVQSGDDRP